MNSANPFQSPTDVAGPQAVPRRPGHCRVFWATGIWLALAALMLLLFYLVRPLVLELQVALPTVTLYLLHPMATVMSLVVAFAVLFHGAWGSEESTRRRTGTIGIALGLVALAIVVVGAGLPVISLLQALSE